MNEKELAGLMIRYRASLDDVLLNKITECLSEKDLCVVQIGRGKFYTRDGLIYVFFKEEHAKSFLDHIGTFDKAKVVLLRGKERKALSDATAKVFSVPPVSVTIKVSELIPDTFEEYLCHVKTVLDTFSDEERSKYPDAYRILNIHDLVGLLAEKKKLSLALIDKDLSFKEGYTEEFAKDILGCSCEKAVLKKYLKYFGLERYLYSFKQYSVPLMEELKKSDFIDKYELRSSNLSAKEPFKLIGICRGLRNEEGAYVYRADLISKHREISVVLSCALGLETGREYQVIGLDPITEGKSELNKLTMRF